MARRRLISADMWDTLFSVVYLALGTNAMVVLAAAPLVVLSMTTDPRHSWPALAIAAVAAAPAASAAFAVFHHFSVNRSTEVIRGFWRGWVRHLRRSLAVGLGVVAGTVVMCIDIVALADHRPGALFVPVLAVLIGLLWATGLHALVASVERPDARLRDVAKAGLFLGVRRWYLTLVSFAALGTLSMVFVQSPAIALGVATAPLLYAAWGNTRYSLRPVLPHGASVHTG